MKYGLLLLVFGLAGCGRLFSGDVHDPSLSLSRDDFFEMTVPVAPAAVAPTVSSDPLETQGLSPLLKTPVSLDITPTTSLESVFRKLTQALGIGFAWDPAIKSKIIYSAQEVPLGDALATICAQAALRFSLTDKVLRIEMDRPYFKSYDVRFLTIVRTNESNVSINTGMLGMHASEKEQKLSNGSHTVLEEKALNDFWKELEENLKQLLSTDTYGRGDVLYTLEKTPDGAMKKIPVAHQPGDTSHFSINKQAGIINIYATDRQHQVVEGFLTKIKKSLSRQILIEAKVVEVTLKDEYRNGINWAMALGDFNAGVTTNLDFKNAVHIGASGKKLSGILNIMESFGTVRTLSSPRLTVMNNQTALLKVADNLVFFQIKYDREYYLDENNRRVQNLVAKSSVQTVPVGFIMTVQPAINEENEEIILTLRPTITRVMDQRNDPAVQLMAAAENKTVQSEIPVIAVREMSSVLRMSSGQVSILGGLMQESAHNTSTGLPGFSETPLHLLTGSKADEHRVVELVIFIKATILKDSVPHGADKRVYQNYFQDPRPMII